MLGKTHRPRVNHTRRQTHRTMIHFAYHRDCLDFFTSCPVWRSNSFWDLKNNHIFWQFFFPHPHHCYKGPSSLLIAFHWSCPIRYLLFIFIPSLSLEHSCQFEFEPFLYLNYTQSWKQREDCFHTMWKRFGLHFLMYLCVLVWNRISPGLLSILMENICVHVEALYMFECVASVTGIITQRQDNESFYFGRQTVRVVLLDQPDQGFGTKTSGSSKSINDVTFRNEGECELAGAEFDFWGLGLFV